MRLHVSLSNELSDELISRSCSNELLCQSYHDPSVSRHHWYPIEGPSLKPPLHHGNMVPRGLLRGPQLDPIVLRGVGF